MNDQRKGREGQGREGKGRKRKEERKKARKEERKEGRKGGRKYGWRRPNHMHSHLDVLQTMTSVEFRRVPGSFHSVAQRASSCVVFRGDFRGFGRPTWTQKSTFGHYFCDVIFECVFSSSFDRFLEAPNLKNSNFPQGKR